MKKTLKKLIRNYCYRWFEKFIRLEIQELRSSMDNDVKNHKENYEDRLRIDGMKIILKKIQNKC